MPSAPHSSNRTRYGTVTPATRSGRTVTASRRLAAGQPVEPLERHEAQSVERDGSLLADEADLARPPGVEHHEPHEQAAALVRGAPPRVIELVDHLGLDAARAPLAVP